MESKGEQSKRLQDIQRLMEGFVDGLFKTDGLRPESVEGFFPEDIQSEYGGQIAKHARRIFKGVRKNIGQEFDEICKQRDLPRLLAELDAKCEKEVVLSDGRM